MTAAALRAKSATGQAPGGDALAAWAERTGRRQAAEHGRGQVRFVFYGRVWTEGTRHPVTSQARQRDQAGTLVAGHGHIVAESFDIGAEPDAGVGPCMTCTKPACEGSPGVSASTGVPLRNTGSPVNSATVCSHHAVCSGRSLSCRAVRGIADARTSPTRQQHRAALEQHARRSSPPCRRQRRPRHDTGSHTGARNIPFAGLPPLQGLPDISIQAERGSEDAAPGSFDDLARRLRERSRPPTPSRLVIPPHAAPWIALWDVLETLIAAREDCRKSPVDRNDRRSRALTQPILALPRTLVVATGRASWRRTRDRADGGPLPPRTGRWPLRPPRRLGVRRR